MATILHRFLTPSHAARLLTSSQLTAARYAPGYDARLATIVPVPSARTRSFSWSSSSAIASSQIIAATDARRRRPLPHRPAPQGSGWGGGSESRWNRGGQTHSLLTLFTNRRFNGIPDNAIVYSLIGLNLGVLIAWQYAEERMKRYNDPRWFLFMRGNFLTGEHNLKEGRYWTILTSCVSQSDFGHFALNMISLFFMAPPVLAIVGPASFLSLYFGAGTVCSLVSLSWRRWVDPWIAAHSKPNPRARSAPTGYRWSHGASGSVYGIMTTFACLAPRATFLLFFVIPAPAFVIVPGIFAWDFYNAWFTPNGTTESAGHIGGILAGLLFWRFRLNGLRI